MITYLKYILKGLLCFSFIAFIGCESGGNNENLDNINKQYQKYLYDIDNIYNLNPLEKYEAKNTISSIYSFIDELQSNTSSYYTPFVSEWITEKRKFAGDNPDAQYFSFFIDANALYEVEVNNDNVFFMEVTSYKNQNKGNVISKSITYAKNGKTKFTLSANKNYNPYFQIDDKDYLVMIRYYKKDRMLLSEKPKVVCSNSPLQKKLISKQFITLFSSELFSSIVNSSKFLTNQMKEKPNGYVDISGSNPYVGNLFPAKNNVYNGAFIYLPNDSSYLSIKGTINKQYYSMFVFYNEWWATPYTKVESGTSYINAKDLITDTEGNYEIIISTKPLNLPNNIITNGLSKGVFSIRSLNLEFDDPEIELKEL